MIDVTNIQIGDIVATKQQSIIVERMEHICGEWAFYGKVCRKDGCPRKAGGNHRYIFAPLIFRVTRGDKVIMRK